jgi:tetratricopeptide (TPR) repeat protein
MILYRPVGLQELELIYDSGMKTFPARLPQQPIFYPVLQLDYARQIASEWNAKSGRSAGYVTEFKVEDEYVRQFEEHAVGGSQHRELWIPAEQLEEFNRHITGHIKVVEAHFGDAFQGFVPEKFGLQGKNAVEQFTLLANSYIYKRVDFYLEIKRNHKAVFLNYLFWQIHDFKNPVLKEKVLQAIKEAWLTSFPKIPLPLPPPVQEDSLLAQQGDAPPSDRSIEQEEARRQQKDSVPLIDPIDEENTFEEEPDSNSFVNPVQEKIEPVKPPGFQARVNLGREKTALGSQTNSHFLQGIELGLNGKYREAADALSKAVEAEPKNVAARVSLGVAFHRLGEDDRALASYETALKLEPIYAEAHYFRANILYNRGDVRAAIAGYTMALGLQPELVEAWQKPAPRDRLTDYTGSPGEMYWIAKPAQRILELNQSLASAPGQASLFKERAAQYHRLRNYAQAIADYSSFLAIRPEEAGTLHLRGVAYEQLGQLDRALQDYQQAIAIDPQISDAYLNRGVTFGKTGNFRQAIVSLSEAIRLAPQNADGYFNRGVVYFQEGDLEKAIDDFSKVVELAPGDEEAYYWRGASHEGAGRQQEAIADYRQFLAISQNPQAREQIEQKLSQWNESKRNSADSQNIARGIRQTTNQVQAEQASRDLDLHDLIVALGERALASIWLGRSVECYGEKADDLYAFTDHDRPIDGHDLLTITSGIRQTIEGDFQAFDPGATTHWILIRAWDGTGFYIEINDPQARERLQTRFQALEEVEGAFPPYEGLFIHI